MEDLEYIFKQIEGYEISKISEKNHKDAMDNICDIGQVLTDFVNEEKKEFYSKTALGRFNYNYIEKYFEKIEDRHNLVSKIIIEIEQEVDKAVSSI